MTNPQMVVTTAIMTPSARRTENSETKNTPRVFTVQKKTGMKVRGVRRCFVMGGRTGLKSLIYNYCHDENP
jgi:hypothetical protein